jgi:uncharacterized hydantoinase/oxoprolinase family protein
MRRQTTTKKRGEIVTTVKSSQLSDYFASSKAQGLDTAATAANSAFVSPVKKVQRDHDADDDPVDQGELEAAVSSDEAPNDPSQ